jgi:CysZ protein
MTGEGSSPAQRARGGIRAAAAVPAGLFQGAVYPFKGMRFVYVQHPELARIWVIPILLTFVALTGALIGAWHWHDDVVTLLWSAPSGEGGWAGVERFFHGLVEILVFLLLAVLAVLGVLAITTILAAPFNDALSEEVERLVTGERGPPFRLGALLKDIVRTIGLELIKVGLYVLVMGPVFVLSLVVPGFGQVLYSVFAFLFTAVYFAIDYVDWPAARRDYGVGYRFRLVRRRFAPMFGFGAGVWVLLFVPLLNLLFMPAAVAGGTLLYLDMEGPRGARSDP